MVNTLLIKIGGIGLISLVLAIFLAPAIAQDPIQAISFDELVVGEINLSQIQSSYVFDGIAGETVYLRAQSLTPEFALRYTLLDADGQALAEGTNINGQPGSLSILEIPFTASFTVQINSANNVAGQYTVSVENKTSQGINYLPDGEIIYGNLNARQKQDYQFETVADVTNFLMFESSNKSSAITITIKNIETNDVIAIFRSDISDMCMRMASTDSTYHISVTSEVEAVSQHYQAMLWTSDIADLTCPTSIFTPEYPDAINEGQVLSTGTGVAVSPAGTQAINMRAAPTTNSPVISTLAPGEVTTVIGLTANGDWLMVDVDGTILFVNSEVVRETLGTVDTLPIVNTSDLLNNYNLIDFNVNYEDTDANLDEGDTMNEDGSVGEEADVNQTSAQSQVDETEPITIGRENNSPTQDVVEAIADTVSTATNINSNNQASNTINAVTNTVSNVSASVTSSLLGGD